MQVSRASAGAMLAAWLLASGCTTMREIPRTDFGQIPAGRNVRVETKDGLVYDFDYATVSGDSLSGVRVRNDIEGAVDEAVTFQIALDDIQQLTTRRFDWYRTGLVSGSVVAAVLVGALGVKARNSDSGNGNGGGGKPWDPK